MIDKKVIVFTIGLKYLSKLQEKVFFTDIFQRRKNPLQLSYLLFHNNLYEFIVQIMKTQAVFESPWRIFTNFPETCLQSGSQLKVDLQIFVAQLSRTLINCVVHLGGDQCWIIHIECRIKRVVLICFSILYTSALC